MLPPSAPIAQVLNFSFKYGRKGRQVRQTTVQFGVTLFNCIWKYLGGKEAETERQMEGRGVS